MRRKQQMQIGRIATWPRTILAVALGLTLVVIASCSSAPTQAPSSPSQSTAEAQPTAAAQTSPQAQASSDQIAQLQKQVKELQDLAPGFGEFMLGFQTHFAKAWFAGENANWPLAKFETGEIVEGIDSAKASRPAAGPMLDSFNQTNLAALSKAIDAKDKTQFETAYKTAVDGCNSCHVNYRADAKYPQGRPFIKITVPTQPPVFNQQWTP